MIQNDIKQVIDYVDEDGDENAKIFPQRLMEILTNPSNTDAITWLPHGRAFIIINRQKFANNVLPRYFRKTKYTSFTRKLNRWNFTRVTRGPELGAYYHEFFQRGSESMCTQMYCKNERAKFAVSANDATTTGKESTKATEEAPPTMTTTKEPKAAQKQSAPNKTQSAPDALLKVSNILTKPVNNMPSVDPALQTRAMLLGQQPRFQDPLTQAIIANALRMQQQQQSGLMLQAPTDAMLRMQQLAALQQQQQLMQCGQRKKLLHNYRASAA